MKPSIDLSRPDLAFAGIWVAAIALTASMPVEGITFQSDKGVLALAFFNMFTFFLAYAVVSRLLAHRKLPEPSVAALCAIALEQTILRRFCTTLALWWFPIYCLTIVYSDGWPLIWLITGSEKSYGDFGVPTLSGLLYMVRAFIFAAGVALYLASGRTRYLVLPIVFLLTAIGEVNRGGLVVMLLHGVGVYLLMRKSGVWLLIGAVAIGMSLVLLFGFLGELRGIAITPDAIGAEQDLFFTLPVGFFFAYTYLVSPLNNLYYAAPGLEPFGFPYQTLQPLLPSLVRDLFFEPQQYPLELFSESLNATSFYGPLLADFGLAGAGLVTAAIQLIVSFVHIKARRGSLVYFLIYPVLFMSTVLTVFYLYYLSLITVIYPLLAWAYIRFRSRRLSRKARGHQQSLHAVSAAEPAKQST